MAYVNVAEWKTEQVCEWLKGLENSVLPYVHSFMNHGVNGQQLLSLRPEDLEQLGVLKLGHQEIILEAVEYLRNFHYELDRENLQLLALRLSCQAHSLHNELSRQTDSKPVTTQTLSDVASVMCAVKPLVRWLDRSPFSGQLEYNDKKAELMKLALEMATCAQRDRFAEKPIEEIRSTCGQLAKLADYIIQDITDPMILQPSSLDLATLKKKAGDDLGFYILPSFHGAHQIAEIKFGSAAHQCGKMEEGDEIVQVNYQTVVGWERKNVLELFRESPAEVLLTLKRRPRHTKVYGQIYIKPYRLPSNKKTSYTTRWQHNLPSPRPELLTIPDFTMPLPRHTPKSPSPEPASILDTVNILDTMIIDSSDSDSEIEPPLSTRLYSTKPRNLVQRRATITGASPTAKHGIDIEQFWKELKLEHSTTFQLRDKAASCAHGLDSVSSNLRPQTCLGIEQSKRRKKIDAQTDEKKVQFQEKFNESEVPQSGNSRLIDESKDENSFGEETAEEPTATNITNSNNTSDINVPLDECNNPIRNGKSGSKCIINSKQRNIRNVKERGKLDKSYSTPAYDLTDNEDIEGRKKKLLEQTFCAVESLHDTNRALIESVKSEVQVKVEDFDEQHKLLSNFENSMNARYILDKQNYNGENDNDEQCHSLCEKSNLGYASAGTEMAADYKSSTKNSQSNSKHIVVDITVDSKNSRRDDTTSEIENTSTPVNFHNTPRDVDSCKRTEGKTEESACNTRQYNDSVTSNASLLQKTSSNATMMDGIQLKEEAVSSYNFSAVKERLRADSTTRLTESELTNRQEISSESSKYARLTKTEVSKKANVASHLIPPDPPPRKYLTHSIYNPSESSSRVVESIENPIASERSAVKTNHKTSDLFTEDGIKNATDKRERHDFFEIYNNFAEKQMEFIDDTSSLDDSVKSNSSLQNDPSSKHAKEEKVTCDRPESSTDKCICMNHLGSDCYKPEVTIDSPDGLSCSKHIVDTKVRTLEKDKSFEKGVVNKAMMVARSIGLHGSLGKASNSSPRSSRKRSIIFARKRNVSVRELGPGDTEGWLTYRTRGAGGAWAKAWFVLKCSYLYRFRTQDGTKADCLIALTGFTVSQAIEVKSRKYAFKVYHTGTVFYFAADTEDSLSMWLDAINKATLGADGQNRSSALFSETDESDSENKIKIKNVQVAENKLNNEKSFGSLKKVVRKDSNYKDHEVSGASLDRKYLRFLGAKNQNVPVPTAQFRSYRRVLPTSTPNKKQNSSPNSPDLQMTIAGSTFYGLCTSQSATDMSNNSQDMGDYRRTSERCFTNRNRRTDGLQGFITLEEFMLSQQDEERRQAAGNRSASPRITPLTSDHVHVQHRNLHDGGITNEQVRHVSEASFSNDVIYTRSRSNNAGTNNAAAYGCPRNSDNRDTGRVYSGEQSSDTNEIRLGSSKIPLNKKPYEFYCVHKKKEQDCSTSQLSPCAPFPESDTTTRRKDAASHYRSKCDAMQSPTRQRGPPWEGYDSHTHMHRIDPVNNCDPFRRNGCFAPHNVAALTDVTTGSRKFSSRNHGYSGSSSDLTSDTSYETLQRAKKDVTVSRKGSFNLSSRRDNVASEKNWLDSLRRLDKRNTNSDKHRLKNVAQYQPPPMPSSPFEQEGMRAAFEMHLDKAEQVHKTNRLKSLFSTKPQQKPSTLDISKDSQKTLLGSPRLHRAIFRDKSSNCPQQRFLSRSNSQSPGDSGISQSIYTFGDNSPQTLSQSFSSESTASDWTSDIPSPCSSNANTCCAGHPLCQKGYTNLGRNSLTPPTLPYIPPPTSPPPDYPGLEYPPVFEPGTYSLSDTSVLRTRSKDNHNDS